MIQKDKEKDNRIVIFKQINELLNSCVGKNEKITNELISELRENVIFSAVGYEIGNDTDNEKQFLFTKLSVWKNCFSCI